MAVNLETAPSSTEINPRDVKSLRRPWGFPPAMAIKANNRMRNCKIWRCWIDISCRQSKYNIIWFCCINKALPEFSFYELCKLFEMISRQNQVVRLSCCFVLTNATRGNRKAFARSLLAKIKALSTSSILLRGLFLPLDLPRTCI